MNVMEVMQHRVRWWHVVGLVLLVVVVAGVVWYMLERKRTASLRVTDETDLVGGAE